MLFHAPIFIFVFLPITLASALAFEIFGKYTPRWVFLILASFIFYGYFKLEYIFLLALSMAFNYHFACLIVAERQAGDGAAARLMMSVALTGNIASLAIFKYADFMILNSNAIMETDFAPLHLILPLAISFFTFQQIAYLIDVYADPARHVGLIEYLFFTTFFPHLIAGPICYSSDIVPQMALRRRAADIRRDVQIGLVAFVIGLFKKVILASYFQTVADIGYAQPANLDAATAWTTVLAYSLQIYFDFSAYSDMAIGLGLMFGIRLPLNFYSPYKSSSIIEFWRCWHITLSRFLRDYLYIPLGGSRSQPSRTAVNLMVVMVLAGLWHGAGWTFVLWGAMHGAMLILNHAWRALRGPIPPRPLRVEGAITWLKRVFTFALVTLSWIPFRAVGMDDATSMFLTLWHVPSNMSQDLGWTFAAIAGGIGICWLLPNTAQLLERFNPVCTMPPRDLTFGASPIGPVQARLDPRWALITALMIFAVIRGSYDRNADMFIYFQF